MLQPLPEILLVFPPPLADPAGHLLEESILVLGDEIAHKQVVHGDSLVVEEGFANALPCGPGVFPRGIAVLRDHPAQGDPGVFGQQGCNSLEDLAADILKINVDAVRACGCQCCRQGIPEVADSGIKSQFLGNKVALFRCPCDANDAATLQFGDLPRNLAHTAGGSGDHRRLARLRIALQVHA